MLLLIGAIGSTEDNIKADGPLAYRPLRIDYRQALTLLGRELAGKTISSPLLVADHARFRAIFRTCAAIDHA